MATLFGRRRSGAGATAPGDDSSRLPRELELHDAGFEDLFFAFGAARLRRLLPGRDDAGTPLAGEPLQRLGERRGGVLGVGEDLVALLAGEAAGRDEVLLGVDEEPQQRGAPGRPVGLEDRELLGRGEAVGLELDVEVEGRLVDARRRVVGRGRAVDRGHRQLAILEGILRCLRSSVP